MPGTLKSRGCQICKNRRIKCDQLWPTCSACKRRGYECPGASSLVKFVGQESESSKKLPTRDASRSSVAAQAAANEAAAASYLSPPSMTTTISKDKSGKGHGGFHQFRVIVPKAAPTAAADRVALRLVKNLEGDPRLDAKRYFNYLPSRLAHSDCLRDAVTLFCSTVTDYRLRRPASVSATMACYGQALQSLRKTVEGPRAAELETLASIALLGRSEDFFDPAWKPFRQVHSAGCAYLTERLGPPQANDRYHIGVFLESYECMVFHFIVTGKRCFMNDPEWKPVETICSIPYTHPEIAKYAAEFLQVTNPLFCKAGRFLRKIHKIRSDPKLPENTELAEKIMAVLPLEQIRCRDVCHNLTAKSMELGETEEVDDPNAPGGKVYKSKVDFVGRITLHVLSLRVAMARIRYDLAVLYDKPDATFLFEEYRGVCREMWMYVPLILGIERIIASKAMIPLALAFEGADVEEREFVIDAILAQDHYRMRLPRERTELEGVVVMQAKVLTGRLPMESGA